MPFASDVAWEHSGAARTSSRPSQEWETQTLQKVLNLSTTVLPGGRIEIVNPDLPGCESAYVVVLYRTASEQRSALDIPKEAAGQLLFKTSDDVRNYLNDERDAWNR